MWRDAIGWALTPRILPWVIAGAAALVLGFAHLLEAFGWPPCDLCLRQRVPYWVGIALALTGGLATLPRFKLASFAPLLMIGVALTFLVGMGLAVQHIGVEQHWWKSACSVGGGTGRIEDLMNNLGGASIIACDQTRPFLFGLSLAIYNLLICAGLAALAASIPWRAYIARRKVDSL